MDYLCCCLHDRRSVCSDPISATADCLWLISQLTYALKSPASHMLRMLSKIMTAVSCWKVPQAVQCITKSGRANKACVTNDTPGAATRKLDPGMKTNHILNHRKIVLFFSSPLSVFIMVDAGIHCSPSAPPPKLPW